MGSLIETRRFWTCAGTFPPDKEAVYPEHAKAQEFDRHRGKTVLEYGCGGGSDALSYLRRGCQVTAVDIVPENARVTHGRCLALITSLPFGEATFLRMPAVGVLEDSAPIELPDGMFDVVSSHGVLHHIEDPVPVVSEFFRLLKPGGEVYVMLYTERLWEEHQPRLSRLAESGLTPFQAFGWCTDGDGCPYARAYTENEGRALLEAAGFQVWRVFEYFDGRFRTFSGQKPWGAP